MVQIDANFVNIEHIQLQFLVQNDLLFGCGALKVSIWVIFEEIARIYLPLLLEGVHESFTHDNSLILEVELVLVGG